MNAMQMAEGNPQLQAAVAQAYKLLHRKALTGAAASLVPVPGLDWLVDASLMARVIPQINHIFGLTPEQIAQLSPQRHEALQKTISTVGAAMIGRLVTKEMVLRAARVVGLRLTTQQAVKYVPLAGQVTAAVLGYSAMRYLGEQHIRDCVRMHQIMPMPEQLLTQRTH